ncbi:TRAP transporter large permease [Ammoniphilus resinae]|uniref:Tripartite ATP-independent transporter DctM subunit n=1 Tax=Ammoniphilus resinae TaxID=861532 RepID=A0ABS4GSQ2_9BACL|nr:TRAP transporter large permease [Ammoniphilus resinae]MBP1933281.1 tripartite ATP-independent transporter DctM subunit [Ammoniphilus resinae]
MWVTISSFAVILALGVPIAVLLALTSIIYLVSTGQSMLIEVIAQRVYNGLANFNLLAIPLFILAGELMNAVGITQKLVNFFNLLFGHIKGGLAYVNIFSSMCFAGISGTATSDAAAIGGVLIPAMKKEGYDVRFSAALTSAASTIGPIIPPSMIMILYAVFANTSVAALFIGGVIPGILIGIFLVATVYIQGRKNAFPKTMKKASFKEVRRGFLDAILAFLMPLIILVGLTTGVFTATESGAAAVAYALIIGLFIYRSITLKEIYKICMGAGIFSANILIIAGTGSFMAWVLAAGMVPQTIATSILEFTQDPYLILFLINIFLLIVGMFMDTTAALIILVPVLLPIIHEIGVDPVHFGVVLCFNLIQGLITPPLGVNLFITSQIAGIKFEEMLKPLTPYLCANIIVLFLITYIPQLVTWLPDLLLK